MLHQPLDIAFVHQTYTLKAITEAYKNCGSVITPDFNDFYLMKKPKKTGDYPNALSLFITHHWGCKNCLRIRFNTKLNSSFSFVVDPSGGYRNRSMGASVNALYSDVPLDDYVEFMQMYIKHHEFITNYHASYVKLKTYAEAVAEEKRSKKAA